MPGNSLPAGRPRSLATIATLSRSCMRIVSGFCDGASAARVFSGRVVSNEPQFDALDVLRDESYARRSQQFKRTNPYADHSFNGDVAWQAAHAHERWPRCIDRRVEHARQAISRSRHLPTWLEERSAQWAPDAQHLPESSSRSKTWNAGCSGATGSRNLLVWSMTS